MILLNKLHIFYMFMKACMQFSSSISYSVNFCMDQWILGLNLTPYSLIFFLKKKFICTIFRHILSKTSFTQFLDNYCRVWKFQNCHSCKISLSFTSYLNKYWSVPYHLKGKRHKMRETEVGWGCTHDLWLIA